MSQYRIDINGSALTVNDALIIAGPECAAAIDQNDTIVLYQSGRQMLRMNVQDILSISGTDYDPGTSIDTIFADLETLIGSIASSGGGGGTPSGAAGGQLAGTYPNPLLNESTAHIWLAAQGIRIDGSGSTVVAGWTLSNQTVATSLAKQQFAPARYWLGTQWNGTASVICGFRETMGTNASSIGPGSNAAKPFYTLDYTLDGTTWVNVITNNPMAGSYALNVGSMSIPNGGLSVGANGINVTGGSISVDKNVITNGFYGGLTTVIPDVDDYHYTILDQDYMLNVDATDHQVTIDLDAWGRKTLIIHAINSDQGIYLAPHGTGTLNGSASPITLQVGETMGLICNGTNWETTFHYKPELQTNCLCTGNGLTTKFSFDLGVSASGYSSVFLSMTLWPLGDIGSGLEHPFIMGYQLEGTTLDIYLYSVEGPITLAYNVHVLLRKI